MRHFDNLKVNTKLFILILVSFISLITVGGVGYYYLQKSNEHVKTLYKDRLIPNDAISNMLIQIEANKVILSEMVLDTSLDMHKKEEKEKIIGECKKKSNESMAVLKNVSMDSKGLDLLSKIENAQNNYRPVRDDIIALVMENKNAEARILMNTKLPAVSDEYRKEVDLLDNYYADLARKANEDNEKAAKDAIRIIVGFIIIMSILLIVIGRIIARMITIPLESLVIVCKDFASGDFRDNHHKLFRKDEIGEVADALANMRTAISELMKKISYSSEQVAASSQELTASAEQSAQASNLITESISNIAEGANNQMSSTSETSNVIEHISAGIQHVAANSNQVADQTSTVVDKAKDGNKVIDNAITQMNAIAETTNNFAKNIAVLNEKSQNIGQIVDTISGIASQTNLLALNAAIEAARAGDHGRGFAVVADEVRNLAEESQKAAKKIAELISEIQSDSNNAVIAMTNNATEVKNGTDVVTTAGLVFQEIVELVSRVSDRVREISAAIQQMASDSQQIVDSIKKIDSLSQKSAGDSQSVSAATEEQLASMQEIASSSQALANLAQDLQEAVSKFKV